LDGVLGREPPHHQRELTVGCSFGSESYQSAVRVQGHECRRDLLSHKFGAITDGHGRNDIGTTAPPAILHEGYSEDSRLKE